MLKIVQSDNALLEEMRNINRHFIETVLELDTDEIVNRRLANAGTVLRCSYRAATEGKNSVFHSENNTLKVRFLAIFLFLLSPTCKLDAKLDQNVYENLFPLVASAFSEAACAPGLSRRLPCIPKQIEHRLRV